MRETACEYFVETVVIFQKYNGKFLFDSTGTQNTFIFAAISSAQKNYFFIFNIINILLILQ